MLALGQHLVRELGKEAERDTLARWMAHHVAELIDAAAEAGADREQTRDRACTTILKLWEHRASLPGHVDPLKRYEHAISTLSRLSPQANPWERNGGQTEREKVACNIYDDLTEIVLGLLLIDAAAQGPLSSDNEKLVESFLAPKERVLIRFLDEKLGALGEGPDVSASLEDESSREPLPVNLRRRLIERVDDATNRLKDIRRILARELKPGKRSSATSSKRATRQT